MLKLFYGSDAYRIKTALAERTAVHRQEHGCGPDAFDLLNPDDVARFQQAIGSPSFFGERRLLIAHNPLALSDIVQQLTACGAASTPDADYVLVQPTTPKMATDVARKLKHLETLASSTKRFEPLTGQDAAQWAHEFCKDRGHTITDTAIQELFRRIDGSGWATAGELEKLCAYTDSEIGEEAVRALVTRPPLADQWELSNALAAQDKRGTLIALWRKVREGTAEPLLVGMIAAALRNLLMIRDFGDRGKTPAAIATATGIHPFVVGKTLRGARAYSPLSLRASQVAIATLDRRAKIGQTDTVDGLFSILLQL